MIPDRFKDKIDKEISEALDRMIALGVDPGDLVIVTSIQRLRARPKHKTIFIAYTGTEIPVAYDPALPPDAVYLIRRSILPVNFPPQ